MTYSLDFEILGLPPLNSADGMHWRKRHGLKRRWIRQVWALARPTPAKPLKRARVHITRCSSAQPDNDNLRYGAKFLLDGLVLAGIIQDDKPAVIGDPVCDWEKVAPKNGRVRIRVEEVEE